MCSYCYGELFASFSDLTHIQTNVLITVAQCGEIPGKQSVKRNSEGKKKEDKTAAAALHKVLLSYQVGCAEGEAE